MHICFLFVGLRVPEKIKSSSPLNLATVNEYSESKVKNNQWTSKGQWHFISVKRKETLSLTARAAKPTLKTYSWVQAKSLWWVNSMTNKKTVAIGIKSAALMSIGRRRKMTRGKKASTQERIMYWGKGQMRWVSKESSPTWAGETTKDKEWLALQGVLSRQVNWEDREASIRIQIVS